MLEATFVVVGGGIAGITCAENLAYLKPELNIILLTKSKLIKSVTNLVPVTKMLYDFNVVEKEASTLNGIYPNIQVIYEPMVRIDSQTSEVVTDSKRIKYEYLCLCLGGQPNLIKNEAKFQNYILGIRDTDSVQILQNRLKGCRKVMVVGNGGIASELVNELKNIEIIWVIKDSHISATFIDPGAAEFFQEKVHKGSENPKSIIKRIRYLEHESAQGVSQGCAAALGPDWHTHFDISGTSERKIHIEYNCEIDNITEGKASNRIKVKLTNEKEIDCDLIISATGVLPTQILTDAPIKLAPDQGISVNDRLETSIPKIYAAGDCCSTEWEPAKHWFQMRLWSQARQMGAYAAKSMIADMDNEVIIPDFCFEMFAHATSLFNYKVALLGLYNGQKLNNQYEILLRTTPKLEYIKLVIVDGKIQGAILIGDTGLEETIENLILNQLDVTPYGDDLLNPAIDIEDYFD